MKNTEALVKELYPIVEKAMDKNINKYKQCIGRFIESRNQQLYDTVPCQRMYYTQNDESDLMNSIGIEKDKIYECVSHTYYSSISAFNPRCAKDELTVLALMIIRYFYIKNKPKELELAMIYLSFSGKIYTSIHYNFFRKVEPARHIMEYVINNELSQKYDIKSAGSIIGAVKSIDKTWLVSYGKKLKSTYDEDMVYILQQLHNRIKSFMKNIASEYYKAYENKDVYITYDADNLEEDNYHLADNDSLKAERVTETAMNKINTSSVDYKLCKMCSDSNIKTEEIKTIIESILTDKENLSDIRELISLITISYFTQSKEKDVRRIDFITYSIAPKPNAKNKDILRQKEIVENLLCENSTSYIRRRSRLATKNSYNRAIFMYFTLIIHYANK